MHSLDIFPEIVVLGRYIDIGHIAAFSAREYDFFSEGGIFLEDNLLRLFWGKYRTEESGGSSADDNDIVHE